MVPCECVCYPLPSSVGLQSDRKLIWSERTLAVNDCGKWLNNVGNGNRYDGTYYIPGQPAIKPEFNAVGSCEPWNVSLLRPVRVVTLAHAREADDSVANGRAGLEIVEPDDQERFAHGRRGAHGRSQGQSILTQTRFRGTDPGPRLVQHFFFWTWKTGYSSTMGQIANPMWNYQLGLAEGWVPSNPRTAVGVCPSLAAAQGITYESTAAPSLSAWMTGGSGAGRIVNQTMSAQYSQWPPATIGAGASTGPYLTPVSNLPTYTQTASVYTMPPPPQPTSFPDGYASSSVDVGNGWAQPSDSASFYTPVAGCSYPNAWSGAGVAIPTTAFCAGNGARMKRNIKSTATIVFQPTPAPTPAAV